MSEALTTSNCATIEQFAAVHGLSVQEAVTLLNNADFTKGVQETTKARARVAFHGVGVERLIRITSADDDKTALSAITLLGKLAGEFKAPRPVMLNFEELRKAAATVPAGPLSDITQIREAEAIDAEEEEDG